MMIEICVINGVPFIWKAGDVCMLREEHRIVGCLVGCHPRYPKQNLQLSLPLELRPEEATLLVEKGICTMRDASKPAPMPTQEDVKDFRSFRKQLHLEQIELMKVEKRKTSLLYREQIIAGRKKKKERMLARRRAAGDEVKEEELAEEEDECNDLDDLPVMPITEKQALVQMFAGHPIPATLPLQPANWSFPATPAEQLRYRTFKELWEQGYFITNGAKFGGDFLVYPGDPARFHSFYIAICITEDEPISSLDLTAFGRMGSNVKKTAVLCSLNHEDKVTFTSVQWTAIS